MLQVGRPSAPWSSYNTLPLAEGYKLQVTSSKLQFTCYKLHFTCCKLKVTSYKLVGPLYHDHHTTPCPWLEVTYYKFQLKIYKLQGMLGSLIGHHISFLAFGMKVFSNFTNLATFRRKHHLARLCHIPRILDDFGNLEDISFII